MWDACHAAGLRGAYLCACEAAALMIETAQGASPVDPPPSVDPAPSARPLVAVVSSFGGQAYTFNVAYGVGKAAADRLVADMAVQVCVFWGEEARGGVGEILVVWYLKTSL